MRSWIPWKYFVRRAAQRHGFIDPVGFLARMRQFAQPSEVQEPIELIRAGVRFHARGLINTKVLQNNLDWVWPYWVERQFDPGDPSFLPRAFSFSHVNLTHRNWTAVGLPDVQAYPIVDPRGLVTPLYDGWSLDWWFLPDRGPPLFPSREAGATQRLEQAGGLAVVTSIDAASAQLETSAFVEPGAGGDRAPVLRLVAKVMPNTGGRLVLAVRPANPEGVRFIDFVRCERAALHVNGEGVVHLDEAPGGWLASHYATGDVSGPRAQVVAPGRLLRCPAGLATAAAVYSVRAGELRTFGAALRLRPSGETRSRLSAPPAETAMPPPSDGAGGRAWREALAGAAQLEIPDARWRRLYEAARHTLVLLSPGEVYPGPFTYRRFWYRDACLIMHALLGLNLPARVRRALERFPARQRVDGYFHSQEGEWDSNGEVLWIADRYERLTGQLLGPSLLRALMSGARWIVRKRSRTQGGRHAGLLPPGFSAEHLGPNDYYYWDDFWGVAGLRAAAELKARRGATDAARELAGEAAAFSAAVRRSLAALPPEVAAAGIPASPYRRMDAGAIGSLVADYPLQLADVDPAALRATAGWLWEHCRFGGGFFQDMIHSGVNAYLTLALAQTFLRAGDSRHGELIEAAAAYASPTGQWPEAVHPRTGGGCMGDGQHAWAAAEWVMMMRALFLREETAHLVIGSGLPAHWLQSGAQLAFGPTLTPWGPVTIRVAEGPHGWEVAAEGRWYRDPPRALVQMPGFQTQEMQFPAGRCRLVPAAS